MLSQPIEPIVFSLKHPEDLLYRHAQLNLLCYLAVLSTLAEAIRANRRGCLAQVLVCRCVQACLTLLSQLTDHWLGQMPGGTDVVLRTRFVEPEFRKVNIGSCPNHRNGGRASANAPSEHLSSVSGVMGSLVWVEIKVGIRVRKWRGG
jgi:hypothetical protein